MHPGKNSTQHSITLENIRDFIVGYNRTVPLLNGEIRQYINFDNAASTPALKPVLETVNEFMEWYSSIHRGTGFKSMLCSNSFDQAREITAEFVNVELDTHAIIFTQNATEGINKLARRLPFTKDQVVLVSKMEHHSNDLPWRANSNVIHLGVLEDGRLDEKDFLGTLEKYRRKVALVAVTGASNVTGWVNDIHRLAEISHQYGTRILIDAAQMAPHRAIDMKKQDDPGHIDFLVMSAHKFYAPFGSGVLIGDREVFERGAPDHVGGGTISIVGDNYAHWAEVPEKEEAGTPNTVGVVAMAKAMQVLQQIGMEKVAAHEMDLTHHILEGLQQIPEVRIYGSSDPQALENRLGVISFNIDGVPHALTAAILNYEGGIGVRNGCFCAHPYVKRLMGISETEAHRVEQEILAGDRSRLPGAVRASFGVYSSKEEVDAFIETIRMISEKRYQGQYVLDRRQGEYHPQNFHSHFENYFVL